MHSIIVFKTLEIEITRLICSFEKNIIYIYYFEKDLHSTPTSVNDSLPNQGHAETLVFA